MIFAKQYSKAFHHIRIIYVKIAVGGYWVGNGTIENFYIKLKIGIRNGIALRVNDVLYFKIYSNKSKLAVHGIVP